MTRKRFFIMLLAMLGLATILFLFLRMDTPTEPVQGVLPHTKKAAAVRLRLHPLASKEQLALAKQTPVSTWEEWAEKSVELGLATEVLYGWINTPEELEKVRKKRLVTQMNAAKSRKARGLLVPKYPCELPRLLNTSGDDKSRRMQHYQGDQTPEALMAEFDEAFMKSYPESSDWDTHYPKEVWLKRLLDKGAHFEREVDYSYYLELRRDLIQLKEKPSKWRSGGWGIPPTTNFEDYEDGYIDRKIWENDIANQVRAEHPNETQITTYFPSSHPEKYLPVIGRMTYVRRRPDSSGMFTMGARLTQEQRDNLLYKGVEPEDIEIVYIDSDYNVLTEKPKPYNHQEWKKRHTYDITPHGLRAYDGTILSPERYEEIFRRPMDDDLRQRYERYERYVEGAAPVDDAEATRAARAAAKAEFEKFQRDMRQLKQFATMSDAEIEQELEKQFRQQFLPALPSEPSTSAHLKNALGTLHKHGFEEGLGRIKQDNPALAENLERLFRQQSNRARQGARSGSSSSGAQPSPENK